MKKQLMFVALFASAVSLVGCEEPNKPVDPTPGGDVKIVVNPHEVVLTEEEPTIRLSATLNPADASATIVWSSSDTLIATVTNRGVVDAVAYGDCYIYASVGDAKDSCHVIVKSYLESLIFNGAVMARADTTYARDPETGEYKVDTIEASDGSQWRVYLSMATLWVFSDGFYINNAAEFDGTEKGALLEIQAPIYYGTKYLNPEQGGVQFTLGKWGVFEREEPTPHVGTPGALNETEYINQMKQFIEKYNAKDDGYANHLKAAGECVSGALLTLMEYDAEAEGYLSSYIPEALCENAYFSLGAASPASDIMRMLDFSEIVYKPLAMDTTFGANWGLNIGYDDEHVYLNDEQVHYDESITSTYGEVPSDDESAVKAKTPLNMPILSENPALMAKIEQQIKDKNIRVIRMK